MSLFNLFNLISSFKKINFKLIGLLLSGVVVLFSIFEFLKIRKETQDKIIRQERIIMNKDAKINILKSNIKTLKIKHEDEIKKLKLEIHNKCNKEKLFNTFKIIDDKHNYLTQDIIVKKDNNFSINFPKKDTKKNIEKIWVIQTVKDIDKLNTLENSSTNGSTNESINLLIK